MAKPVVLIVDDEPDLCELLSITLGRMAIDSRSVHDIASARTAVKEARFDLCLTDMQLPDGNGLTLVEWLQSNQPELPVAVITAHGNVESAVKALKLGAFDFVSKPLDLADRSFPVEFGRTSYNDASQFWRACWSFWVVTALVFLRLRDIQ